MWRHYFCQILNVHGVVDVRQTEINTAGRLVLEPSASDIELSTEKLKINKSPGFDQILEEMFKAGGKTIRCEIHKLVISIWNKEELPEEWKESITAPMYKKGNKTVCSNYRGTSLLPTMYKTLSNILLSRLTPYGEEITGDHQCGFRRNRSTFDIICIRQILGIEWKYNEAVNQLFIDFKKTYDSVRKEVLYNILIQFDFPMKLVRLIKMCLTETYSRVRVGKSVSDMFPIMNDLKQGDVPSPLLFYFCFGVRH